MKKYLALLLALLLSLLFTSVTFAEPWVCQSCGNENNSNFCPYCGEKRPSEITCPECGTVYDLSLDYTFCPNCGVRLKESVAFTGLKAGDTLTYGHYDQDGDSGNGAEAIEWIVLKSDGETATLISKYALEAKPYNDEDADVTWETCTLRGWLNKEFLEAAFTSSEQAMLKTVTVTADRNPEYNIDPGNDTQDKVFLLSINEVSWWLPTYAERVCMPTQAAVAKGVNEKSDTGACWWWLRTPSVGPDQEANVYYNGHIVGSFVHSDDGAVRPVIVLCLSDDSGQTEEAPALETMAGVGSDVIFGHYDQDGDAGNGAEVIEWIVLESDGTTAKLISKYALEAKPFNDEYTDVTWDTCTLRSWLNGEFLETAFSPSERSRLATVTVTADTNRENKTNPGNDTRDMVFLLSIDEVKHYFSSNEERVCMPTQTAVKNGARTYDSGACDWWLRSPGYHENFASNVHYVGNCSNIAYHVNDDGGAVRPVVVVQLSSES